MDSTQLLLDQPGGPTTSYQAEKPYRHVDGRESFRPQKTRFSRLPAPEEFSPLLASIWADAIVAYWRNACIRGEVNPLHPLDILDLMPGTGQSVLQMLQALQVRLDGLPGFEGSVRYLVVESRRELLSHFKTCAELQEYLRDGRLVPTLWDPERGEPCLLYPGKRERWQPQNPVAILAHDRWAVEKQRLLAVHYGKLLEADIDRLANCTAAEHEAKEWGPVEKSDLKDSLRRVLDAYVKKFNSVPIPLPITAINHINQFGKLAKHGYILFAIAPGYTSDQQMRLNRFSDIVQSYKLHRKVPVNFYLLSQYCKEINARTWQACIKSKLATQIIVGNGRPDDTSIPEFAPYIQALMGCNPQSFVDIAGLIANSRQERKLESLLTLLRHSEYDPRVFDASAKAIIECLKRDLQLDRQPWIDALRRVWLQHLPRKDGVPLHRSFGPVAMRLGAWRMATEAIAHGIKVTGESALDLAHLAWCEMRTGKAASALALVKRAMAIDARDPTVNEVFQTINNKIANWTGGWNTCLPSRSLPIVLEPLDPGHADALWFQYRDPQIAVMTGLPTLENTEAASKWINEHFNDQSRRSYAVIHKEWGLAGYVCLSVTLDEAYFCFWIGADFQGTGLSVESARLLIHHAKQQGVRIIFTSAYRDNVRSLSSLKHIGFERIDIQALPPENDRIFLFMNLGQDAVTDPARLLESYYEREKLPLYFPGQEQRRDADRADAEMKNHASNTGKIISKENH